MFMLMQIAGIAGVVAGRMDTLPPTAVRAALEAYAPGIESAVRQAGPTARAVLDTISFSKIVPGLPSGAERWQPYLTIRPGVMALPTTPPCGDECPALKIAAVITKGDSSVVTFDMANWRWNNGERVFSSISRFVLLIRRDTTWTASMMPGMAFGHGGAQREEEPGGQ